MTLIISLWSGVSGGSDLVPEPQMVSRDEREAEYPRTRISCFLAGRERGSRQHGPKAFALYSMDVSLCLAWPWGAPGGSFLSLFSEPSDQLEPTPRLLIENGCLAQMSVWSHI